MAITPVIQTVSTASASQTGSTLAVSFPSGLTAGDEMLMVVTWYATAARTLTAPSGWTAVKAYGDGTIRFEHNVYRKTASAGDVSAGSITLSWSGTIVARTAGILRITGQVVGTEIAFSEIDSGFGGGTGTTPSYTTNITPTFTDSLIIQTGGAAETSGSARTFSGWTTTPSVTLTEQVDVGAAYSGDNVATGIAAGAYSGTSNFTSRGFTLSSSISGSNRLAGTFIIYNPVQNASGTPTPLVVSPTFFSVSGLVGGSAIIPLFVVSPTLFSVFGNAKTSTIWTGKTKEPQVWTQVIK